MDIFNCKICASNCYYFDSAIVMNKYLVKYYKCDNCGIVTTEKPYWFKEAYANSINSSDTGMLSRNIYLAKIVSILIFILFNKNSKYLDYAGGYGVFVRMMRDNGLDFYWDDKYTENIFSEVFCLDEKENYELVTAFELFEHLVDPNREIKEILNLTDNIFLTTNIIPQDIPKPSMKSWDYYGLQHGQHIIFYSLKSLEIIADNFNLNLVSNGKNIHLLTKKKISKLSFYSVLLLARLRLDLLIKKIFYKTKIFSDQKYILNLNKDCNQGK